MTAATQPSIEDVVLGAMPWIPKVHFHNPFLALENGDDFLRPFHLAAKGELAPYILVVEGSIPNENNKEQGYWASLGTDEKTGQPITTCERFTSATGSRIACCGTMFAAPTLPRIHRFRILPIVNWRFSG
jgi:hydrogenase small subunit